VKYLGDIVSHEGVKLDPKKIKDMREWTILKNLNNIGGLL
jgi:hypothetical protein